ncbi:MAG: hypothetical protein MSH23_06855 [Campylobacter lanienae]|uniref:hypothetical protein n=1 Tax=Campylobacter lanienae TaxID=75658 RepID=UPI002432860E|nr:hypothetical protein [Campylobacter lanienae]MCI7364729.1 hypothetical protein [Campylobacter lanienae]
MKVILLNNNPAVSKLVSVSLNKLGFEFVEIDNLESLASGDADLIICDSGLYDSRVDYLKYAKNQLFLIPRTKFEEYNLDPKNTLQKPFLPTDFIDIIKEILNINPKTTQNNDINTQTTFADDIKIGNEFGEIQDLDSISFDSGNDLSSFGDFSDDELLGDTKHIDDFTDKKDDETLNNNFIDNDNETINLDEPDEPIEEQFVENEVDETDNITQNTDELIELDDKKDDEIFELDDEISEVSDDGNIDLNSDEISEINDEISQIDEKISDKKDENSKQSIKDITDEYKNIELDISALDNLSEDNSEDKIKEPMIEIQEAEEPKEIDNLDYSDNLNELSNMLDEIDNMDCEEESVDQTKEFKSSCEASTIDDLNEIDIKKALNETITQTDETAQNQTPSIDIAQANTNDSSQTDINRDELAKILSKQIGDEISKALSNSALKDILKDIDINVNISFKGKK